MQNNYIPNIDISSLITSDFDNENYKYVSKEIKKASEEIVFLLLLVTVYQILKLKNCYLLADIFFIHQIKKN